MVLRLGLIRSLGSGRYWGGDLCGVKREIELAKRRFGLFGEARVLSCYEAGRDIFLVAPIFGSPGGEESGCGFIEYRGEPEGEVSQDGQIGP